MLARFILVALLAGGLSAQQAASIADAAFLEGTWEGEALGGWCEEVWSQPKAGAMMGVFRLIEGEQTRFYEIMQLVEAEGKLLLRLKHFDASLHGWEEKDKTVDFPLLRSAPGLLEFERMLFRKVDDDHVTVTVAIGQDDGSVRNIDFVYSRLKR